MAKSHRGSDARNEWKGLPMRNCDSGRKAGRNSGHLPENFEKSSAAIASQKGSFSAEALAGDFGSKSGVARAGIQAFYGAIIQSWQSKPRQCFQRWKTLLGEAN